MCITLSWAATISAPVRACSFLLVWLFFVRESPTSFFHLVFPGLQHRISEVICPFGFLQLAPEFPPPLQQFPCDFGPFLVSLAYRPWAHRPLGPLLRPFPPLFLHSTQPMSQGFIVKGFFIFSSVFWLTSLGLGGLASRETSRQFRLHMSLCGPSSHSSSIASSTRSWSLPACRFRPDMEPGLFLLMCSQIVPSAPSPGSLLLLDIGSLLCSLSTSGSLVCLFSLSATTASVGPSSGWVLLFKAMSLLCTRAEPLEGKVGWYECHSLLLAAVDLSPMPDPGPLDPPVSGAPLLTEWQMINDWQLYVSDWVSDCDRICLCLQVIDDSSLTSLTCLYLSALICNQHSSLTLLLLYSFLSHFDLFILFYL